MKNNYVINVTTRGENNWMEQELQKPMMCQDGNQMTALVLFAKKTTFGQIYLDKQL